MNTLLLALFLTIILILLLKLKFKVIPEWSFKEIYPIFFWGYVICYLISYFFTDVIVRKLLIIEDFKKTHYEYEYPSFKSDMIVNNSKYKLYLEKVIYQTDYKRITSNPLYSQSYSIIIKPKHNYEFDLDKIEYFFDKTPPNQKMISNKSGGEVVTYWLHFDIDEIIHSFNY